MTNDIGMVKPGLGQIERTSPTAKADNVETSKEEKQKPSEKAAADAAEAKQIAEEVASGLNELVYELHRELRFSVDKDSGDTVIKVIDRETDEVVREIPSEEVMRMRKRLEEAQGVIFQDSA